MMKRSHQIKNLQRRMKYQSIRIHSMTMIMKMKWMKMMKEVKLIHQSKMRKKILKTTRNKVIKR
jgi:hypothetical protein